ncbi:RRM domain-containing protein [Mycena chlorophos]|uniref:RRM domain-containing protein n=1 Tax=Mycena chlorophos TaxID=658473 RepID=A0A8H6W2Y5_MYCCL|nr:RRM domain-containing protein [Mycena chlorophos]
MLRQPALRLRLFSQGQPSLLPRHYRSSCLVSATPFGVRARVKPILRRSYSSTESPSTLLHPPTLLIKRLPEGGAVKALRNALPKDILRHVQDIRIIRHQIGVIEFDDEQTATVLVEKTALAGLLVAKRKPIPSVIEWDRPTRTIFITGGGLGNLGLEYLPHFFSGYGKVSSARMFEYLGKTWARISFESLEGAMNAIQVTRSMPKTSTRWAEYAFPDLNAPERTLCILATGNIEFYPARLREDFEQFGTIEDIRIPWKPRQHLAFVTFADAASAARALDAANGLRRYAGAEFFIEGALNKPPDHQYSLFVSGMNNITDFPKERLEADISSLLRIKDIVWRTNKHKGAHIRIVYEGRESTAVAEDVRKAIEVIRKTPECSELTFAYVAPSGAAVEATYYTPEART